MNKKYIIIFHKADLDGHVGGALLKFFYNNANMIGLDYGEKFDESLINNDDMLFLVDFSLQPFERVKRLYDRVKSMTIIDHHQDFINFCKNNNINIIISGGEKEAACLLVYKEYFGRDIPLFIKLLSDYDTWNDADYGYFKNVVLPFQYGLRIEETNPATVAGWKFWDKILKNMQDKKKMHVFVKNTIKKGEIILKYLKRYYANLMEDSFEIEIDGLKGIAINSDKGKIQFESKSDLDKYDFMLTFKNKKGEYWTLSFYTEKDNVDCSQIAKKFGGGGHKKAAGCQIDNITLYEILKKKV